MLAKMCSYAGCRTIVRNGSHRCSKHSTTPRRKTTVERSKFYGLAAWVKLSKYHRQSYPICEICRKELSSQVDHMIELSLSDEHRLNPDNLIACCGHCHHAKSMKMRKLMSYDNNEQQIYLWLYNWCPREENKTLLNKWRSRNDEQTKGCNESPTNVVV